MCVSGLRIIDEFVQHVDGLFGAVAAQVERGIEGFALLVDVVAPLRRLSYKTEKCARKANAPH